MTELKEEVDRISTEVSAQETLLDHALAAIANKAAGGGGGGELNYVTGTFTTSNAQLSTIEISGLGFQPKHVDVFAGGDEYDSFTGTATTGRTYLAYVSRGVQYGYIFVNSKLTGGNISCGNDLSKAGLGVTMELTEDGFKIRGTSTTKYTYAGTYRYYAYK